MQAALLPREAPKLDGYDIGLACAQSSTCSGDLFDVFPLDDETLALCIADVSGKGLEAAHLMRELHVSVRACAPEADSPAELCTMVNRILSGKIAPGKYATMFYGMLHAESRTLRYENAGHCLPLLVRGDGAVEFPASFSGVLGLFSHWLYQSQEIQLRSGDRLLLLTDGVIAAEARGGREFGYRRLIAAVQNARGSSAAALGRAILDEVSLFSRGKLRDDASLIVVSVA